ncbi:hypothetical protein [Micromonospora zhanjiangensis]|uniref:LPXTG-motif cell wall anchor domain-containing protein n=1 Tax=Micromonospora zhanjiangensis TaxID=1522057 RepID=A0ABV8KMJ8_9ACTN
MTDHTSEPNDPQVDETEREQRTSSAAARLFDIRRVIGGLFLAYGLIVTVVGLLDGQSELDKAQGVRINLWAGLGMLALGLFFLVSQWLRPAQAPEGSPDADRPARDGDS